MKRSFFAFFLVFAAIVTPGPAAAHTSNRGSKDQASAVGRSALAFIGTLSPDQRAKVIYPFDNDAARTNWSNLPSNQYKRDGLALGDLTAVQRIAFHDMLASAMSSQGYSKSASIMWLDDILRQEETERLADPNLAPERRTRLEQLLQRRSSGNYWVVIFGQPTSARWGWMLSGHHLAANFTVVDGKVAFTPLFVGAAPQVIKQGPYAGWRVLEHEMVRGFALARSLTPRQREIAIIAPAVTNELFTGKGRKDDLKTMVGIPASRLDKDQQHLLWGLVREFVGSAADEAANTKLTSIERDGLNKLHFAWWGSVDDPAQQFMYRIHGPSVLIEYVRETERSVPANHVHAIVRDPRNDYGEDWLAKHYREQPHP